jgi:hypothetical protein
VLCDVLIERLCFTKIVMLEVIRPAMAEPSRSCGWHVPLTCQNYHHDVKADAGSNMYTPFLQQAKNKPRRIIPSYLRSVEREEPNANSF